MSAVNVIPSLSTTFNIQPTVYAEIAKVSAVHCTVLVGSAQTASPTALVDVNTLPIPGLAKLP